MEKASKEFWDDFKWGQTHHSEFLTQFKDQWVAISNKEIIASGTNLAKVKQDALHKTGRKQIPLLYIECGEHIYVQN